MRRKTKLPGIGDGFLHQLAGGLGRDFLRPAELFVLIQNPRLEIGQRHQTAERILDPQTTGVYQKIGERHLPADGLSTDKAGADSIRPDQFRNEGVGEWSARGLGKFFDSTQRLILHHLPMPGFVASPLLLRLFLTLPGIECHEIPFDDSQSTATIYAILKIMKLSGCRTSFQPVLSA
jgi:hypothetical protein